MQVFGMKLPDIKLPKFDLKQIGKEVLNQGIETLKTVAKDMFTPATDGKGIFQANVDVKVGPLEMRLKNPVEALAQKLLGELGNKAREFGFNTDAIADAIRGGTRPVADLGEIELPALPERAKAYAPEIGGGVKQAAAASSTKVAEIGGASSTAISAAGTDIADSVREKVAPQLSSMDKKIDSLLAEIKSGGDNIDPAKLNELQLLMQRRNELYQLMTQIMNLEHETKRNIIGNIR